MNVPGKLFSLLWDYSTGIGSVAGALGELQGRVCLPARLGESDLNGAVLKGAEVAYIFSIPLRVSIDKA